MIVDDLESLARGLGDRIAPIRPAVQSGRPIAALNRSAGLSHRVAFMDPA